MKSMPRQINPAPKRINAAMFKPLFLIFMDPIITIAAMTATTASIGNPTGKSQSICPSSILSITSKNIAGGRVSPIYKIGSLFGNSNGADITNQARIRDEIEYNDQVTVLLTIRSMKRVISKGINNDTLITSQISLLFCFAVRPSFSVLTAGSSGYFLM